MMSLVNAVYSAFHFLWRCSVTQFFTKEVWSFAPDFLCDLTRDSVRHQASLIKATRSDISLHVGSPTISVSKA